MNKQINRILTSIMEKIKKGILHLICFLKWLSKRIVNIIKKTIKKTKYFYWKRIANRYIRRQRKFKKKQEGYAYFFNWKNEYKVYKYVGSYKKRKITCRNYTAWKTCFLRRHKELMEENNKQNFLHYIYGKLSVCKAGQMILMNVVMPILTAILTIFAALAIAKIQVYNQEISKDFIDALLDHVVYLVLFLAVFIEIVVLHNFISNKKEISIFEDVCSIITEIKD
jgi:hypothetical protein